MSGTKKRILHFGPNDREEGIAKYQHQYVDGMQDVSGFENVFFGVSPIAYRGMNPQQRAEVLARLSTALRDFDILHLQHEFGLFADTEFADIVQTGKQSGKKVVVTVHLSPAFAIQPARLGGLGPRSLIAYLRARRHRHFMIERHVTPMLAADRLIVHNNMTVGALQSFGADPEKIVRIPHPVQVFDKPPKSTLLAKRLSRKPSDVIYGITGYIYKVKGTVAAVKALQYLPENYKLAIIGGVHPLSNDIEMYDRVADLVAKLGLKDRVYITGFIEDDNELNGLIQECDMVVYPYDRVYYAHLSSGALNLGFANHLPVVAYPTESFKEVAAEAGGALVLTETFAYYELAEELQRLDLPKQRELSKAYAEKMKWPKVAKQLIEVYRGL
jgi:glycosyltransferase involved in cell wall biosynthesis